MKTNQIRIFTGAFVVVKLDDNNAVIDSTKVVATSVATVGDDVVVIVCFVLVRVKVDVVSVFVVDVVVTGFVVVEIVDGVVKDLIVDVVSCVVAVVPHPTSPIFDPTVPELEKK